MKIIPAIDLMNGEVVRLVKGDPNQKTVYSNNPVEIANIYKSNNATCLSVLTEENYFLGNFSHISNLVVSIDSHLV